MIETIKAIDIHAHFGDCKGFPSKLVCQFMSGDPQRVLQMAAMANIKTTFVSPLMALFPRRGGNPLAGNLQAAEVVAKTPGLRQWVVVDPLKPETYVQATGMLRNPLCVGIKIHPEEHGYRISEYGDRLFSFAAENRAVILTHSGEQNSMPEDMVKFADAYPAVRIILAHLGCGWDGDPMHQVRAIQAARYGNLFTDTSSAQNFKPHLVEWAVKEIGSEKIMFGTDSILYFAPMQRCRIDKAEISAEDKKNILYKNAERLFGIE